MAVRFLYIILLCVPMKRTWCEQTAPRSREPHCKRTELRDLHAVLADTPAVSCSAGPRRVISAVCNRGFEPNGNAPQAECCLILTVTSETAEWMNIKGKACVKNSTASGTTKQPTPTSYNTFTPTSPNTSTTNPKPTTHSTTKPPSTTRQKTQRPTSTSVSTGVATTPFTTVPVRPWFTVTTSKWHTGKSQNVTWMKAGCILFIASEIVFSFVWKGVPYKFNSTLMQADMKSMQTNMSCSGPNHTLSGGWYKGSQNITFSATFQESNGSWYATHMEHNNTDLKTSFTYDRTYFKTPSGNSFYCGQSKCISKDGVATIVFRNITVQAFQVAGVKFASSTTNCSSPKLTATSELTVLIVCISLGSIALFVTIAYFVFRRSRSEYDFLR